MADASPTLQLHAATVDRAGEVAGDLAGLAVPWWSFTKTLIAACVLRLAEAGAVALDEPLADLASTPRDLLQHRGGVGNYVGLAAYHAAVAADAEPWSDAELFARVPPGRLLFRPRQGWAYSNIGYLLLRRLIERTCGADLTAALPEIVLRPLGLTASRVARTRDDMASTAFPIGHGYHPGWVFHGTVIGPAAEAALALHRLLRGPLLTPASRAAMLDRHLLGGPLPGRPWTTTGYGLGLMTGTMQHADLPRPLSVTGHSAGGPGSVGAVYHVPDSGRTAAVFTTGTDEGVAEAQVLRLLASG